MAATSERNKGQRSLGGWLSRATVIALTLALVAWLAGFVQQNSAYSFDSDEGVHAYEALRHSTYLRDGDVVGALAASLRQSFYPPVHPWLLGMALTFLPATHVTARLFSLAVYALDALLLYALGRELARDTRWPWLAGLAAALPMLAAPPAWVMGSLVYIEMMGALFVLLTLWGYWQGVEGREWGWLAAGLGIIAAGLTKYVYGLFLSVPLVLTLVMQGCLARQWRVFLKRLFLMMLPTAVVMLTWVTLPVTRNGLMSFIAAQRDFAARSQPSFFAHLVFYLRSIWLQFSPSPLISAGLLAAFIASVARWRDDKLRPLAFFFAWHLVGISTHAGLAPRFLTTAMPALWLMGGMWAARIADAWPGWIARQGTERKWGARLAMWAAIAALALTAILGLVKQMTLYPTLYMLSLETDARAESLYKWMATVLPPGPARIGLVNDWDQMSGPASGWELTTRRAPAPRRADLVTVWEMHRLPDPTPENVAALRDQMSQRGINYLIAYTAPGVGIKRLQGALAILGDQAQPQGERDFPLRWYWPDKIDHRLYDGEHLDDEQLRQAVEQLGIERSLTVSVYAFRPK
jgi:4-amino-4-deoxy-L-arabinose transferase-like glycosyltransferase